MSDEPSKREQSPQLAAPVAPPSAPSHSTRVHQSLAAVAAKPRRVEFTPREWAFGEADAGVL
jgi:hypothetical protein